MAIISALVPTTTLSVGEVSAGVSQADMLSPATALVYALLVIVAGACFFLTVEKVLTDSWITKRLHRCTIAYAVLSTTWLICLLWPFDRALLTIACEPGTRVQQYMLILSCAYSAIQLCGCAVSRNPVQTMHHLLVLVLTLDTLRHSSHLLLQCLKLVMLAVPEAFLSIADAMQQRLRPLQISLGPHFPALLAWREVPYVGQKLRRPSDTEWVSISLGGLSLSVFWTAAALCSFLALRVAGGCLLPRVLLEGQESAFHMALEPQALATCGLLVLSAVSCWQLVRALAHRANETSQQERRASATSE